MAKLNVNPTRMEMTRLKKKLRTATKGHKLLKDKLDELMKQFLEIVKITKDLRIEVEESLEKAYSSFIIARALMYDEMLEEALMIPNIKYGVMISRKNIMSVDVPVFKIETKNESKEIMPYGFVSTNAELDEALLFFSNLLVPMLKLAESEKTAQLLAAEIEKTRRRVNALENILIPDCRDTIKYITMKLEENERASTVRLMKVKDMVAKNIIKEKKQASSV